MGCSMPGFPVLHCVLEFAQIMSIELVMLPNHFIFCCPFFSLLSQYFPASGSLLISQLFAWGGANNGASASASIPPINIQGWFLYDWLLWCPGCPGDSQKSSPAPQFKPSILQHSAFFLVQLSHLYMTTGKKHSFDYLNFCWQVMSLLFNVLS